MALVEKNAARMVKDTEMSEKFWTTLMEICESEKLRDEMSENLKYFAKPLATEEIVDEILKIVNISSQTKKQNSHEVAKSSTKGEAL